VAYIDTLAVARRLEQSGLPLEQARAVSEAIADAIHDSQPDWSQFSTKEFVRSELRDLEIRIGERLRSQLILFFTVQAGFVGIAAALFKLLSK